MQPDCQGGLCSPEGAQVRCGCCPRSHVAFVNICTRGSKPCAHTLFLSALSVFSVLKVHFRVKFPPTPTDDQCARDYLHPGVCLGVLT